MSSAGSGDRPDTDSDASWANETLSLGVRRVLLNRDLERALGRRAPHQGEPSVRKDGEESQRSDGHPSADG